jgi:peptide/nickel transport system permease protein
MARFILQRLATTIVTLMLVSFITFVIIELPPGDYAERYAFKLSASGVKITEEDIQGLRVRFGLDRPFMVRYVQWVSDIVLHGDFGLSFQFQKPVTEVIGERILFTAILATVTLIFTYGLAIPIGVY